MEENVILGMWTLKIKSKWDFYIGKNKVYILKFMNVKRECRRKQCKREKERWEVEKSRQIKTKCPTPTSPQL